MCLATPPPRNPLITRPKPPQFITRQKHRFCTGNVRVSENEQSFHFLEEQKSQNYGLSGAELIWHGF